MPPQLQSGQLAYDGPPCLPTAVTEWRIQYVGRTGRPIAIRDEGFLMRGASFDALTDQVDFSSPGNSSAAVAGLRPRSTEWVAKRAVCRGLRRLID